MTLEQKVEILRKAGGGKIDADDCKGVALPARWAIGIERLRDAIEAKEE